MSSVPQPCRSSFARVGRNSKQACAQTQTALAREHHVEAFAQGMQVEHVGGCVGKLRLAQDLRAPVAGLLLLRQIDIEYLARQILQAVAIGIGAGQARGDLGAVDRARHGAEGFGERGEIEAGEVENLDDVLVGQQALDIGCLLLPGGDLHHVGRAVARRELHHTKPVAGRFEPHGLGVDRHRAFVGCEVRQITTVQADGHLIPGSNRWCPGEDSNLHASRR